MLTIQKFLDLNNSESVKVAIIGDLMVDEYYDVDATRVSPEYPIPVLRSDNLKPQFVYPGGAGCASLQLSHFNANVSVLGFLDGYSKDAYSHHGMNIRNCVMLPPSGHIPLKRRLYQGQFPLCRWDIEEKDYGIEDLEKYRARLYSFLQKDFDAIVFS
jgi:ADP-heptose synthase, bifunctional sugar kinase/adenylyltransferase